MLNRRIIIKASSAVFVRTYTRVLHVLSLILFDWDSVVYAQAKCLTDTISEYSCRTPFDVFLIGESLVRGSQMFHRHQLSIRVLREPSHGFLLGHIGARGEVLDRHQIRVLRTPFDGFLMGHHGARKRSVPQTPITGSQSTITWFFY